MDVLLALFCCVALVVGMGAGVGVTFYAEKFFGRRAYLVGWLVPILLFGAFYAIYHLWLRLLSCTPDTRLICGEPVQNLFLLFGIVLCVIMLANAAAQISLYLFRHPPAAPLARNEMDETAPPSADAANFEPALRAEVSAEPSSQEPPPQPEESSLQANES